MTATPKVSILLLAIVLLPATEALTIDKNSFAPVVVQGDSAGTCPADNTRQKTIERIQNDIKGSIPTVARQCGDGLWYRIAYINMNDLQQRCPSTWREYTRNSARVCGRPFSASSSCPSTTYATGRQYSKVCGRITGYQVASPDGFSYTRSINAAYMDGISVTYGNPRNHIWTFAAGVTENSRLHFPNNCPCSDTDAKRPPLFVGSNYFCESGNPNTNFAFTLYNSDKLWDGRQCSGEGTCCTGPPWFSVELQSNTTDDIEVRICGNENTNNEDTPIELLEFYVQ